MPLKTFQEEAPSLNMTPMIDIVFLLIIFFMVGTKFTEMERQIKLELPKISSVAALSPAPEKKAIHLFRDGRIQFDSQVLGLNDLAARLQQARENYPDFGVLIRGDKTIPLEHVTNVLGACRDAGITQIGFSVELARPRG